ncbi:hypothetical protein [Motiliproteus sp. SC1-56]|uniref:hypothetical protein n=1 Tax=Motiliproteus sp. SC1-56 TaxID=2799565 RepID=UPI001A8FAE1A|nr:hypothetical protein [Motiliproteus sp. SC1-56]
MKLNRKTPEHFHQMLFAPLTSLDRFEAVLQCNGCHYRTLDGLAPQVRRLANDLEGRLAGLEGALAFEEAFLFPRVRQAGHQHQLLALAGHRPALRLWLEQALHLLAALQRADAASSPRGASCHPVQPASEALWDALAETIPELNQRLNRYLQAVESSYLPLLRRVLTAAPATRARPQPQTLALAAGY